MPYSMAQYGIYSVHPLNSEHYLMPHMARPGFIYRRLAHYFKLRSSSSAGKSLAYTHSSKKSLCLSLGISTVSPLLPALAHSTKLTSPKLCMSDPSEVFQSSLHTPLDTTDEREVLYYLGLLNIIVPVFANQGEDLLFSYIRIGGEKWQCELYSGQRGK